MSVVLLQGSNWPQNEEEEEERAATLAAAEEEGPEKGLILSSIVDLNLLETILWMLVTSATIRSDI